MPANSRWDFIWGFKGLSLKLQEITQKTKHIGELLHCAHSDFYYIYIIFILYTT